jgi:two-component system, OmpR family, response regulator
VVRGPALLVVDDEPSLRELLAATLRFVGFRVTSAATGAEAVAAAVAEPPDLVLLDVMLPDLDGFEVARRLRGSVPPVDGRPGRLPILFLSARDATADSGQGPRAHRGR